MVKHHQRPKRDKYGMRGFIDIICEAEEPTRISLKPKDDLKDRLNAFMQDLWDHTYVHPFMRGTRVLVKGQTEADQIGAVIECRPFEGTIRVQSIQTLGTKSGGGTLAMQLLCRLADKHGVVLTGTAKKFGTEIGYMTTKSLKAWYPRFGFVMGRGNAQDGYEMRREPQAPEIPQGGPENNFEARKKAFQAIERDSFSEDPETAARANRAREALFLKTISREELLYYARREEEWASLREGLNESLQPSDLMAEKERSLPGLIRMMDRDSIEAILEMHGEDDETLASTWFDSLMSVYDEIIRRGKIDVFRHMMVEDFEEFIQTLLAGTGRLGQHWSIHYSIESPTWQQDQRGDIPVFIVGEIQAQQIDWDATLMQNFEWPHEGEMIFSGGVMVRTIENQDEDETVKVGRELPR